MAQSSTRAERLSCATAMALLIACIFLVVYFVFIAKNASNPGDDDVNDWYKTREDWLYRYNFTIKTMEEYEPVRLVIIAHTASPECTTFRACSVEMRHLQNTARLEHGHDIAYNFVIGNDGRVYEGRGWNVTGAHTEGYNDCSICVAFIGNYGEGQASTPSGLQLERLDKIIEQGIELGHIHKEYQVLGARDLKATQSPGDTLYNIIRLWPNYASDNVFQGRTCSQIRDLFDNSTVGGPVDDEGWFVSREDWGAPEFTNTEAIDEFKPVRLVVISHTVTAECHWFDSCVSEMRRLQNVFAGRGTDIPYNFMIGNDGRAYEARGWNLVGEHVPGYDECAISVAFIGDYRDGEPRFTNVTELQLERTAKLLEQGMDFGYIHRDFEVLGTKDLRATLSPGERIYNIITEWPNFAHDNIYRGRTCHEIQDVLESRVTTPKTEGVDYEGNEES